MQTIKDIHTERMQFFVDMINDTNQRRRELFNGGSTTADLEKFDSIETHKRSNRESK